MYSYNGGGQRTNYAYADGPDYSYSSNPSGDLIVTASTTGAVTQSRYVVGHQRVTRKVLNSIDRFHADINRRKERVATQVVRLLADPSRPTPYAQPDQDLQGLVARWHDWNYGRDVLQDLSTRMLSR